MAIEPYWGVIIGIGIGALIKLVFSDRKSKRAAARGQCPVCRARFVEKPFTTVTLRVCPQKHGYLSGDDVWISAKHVAKTVRPFKDADFEDLPQSCIIFWTMYHVLSGDGPVDTTRVDNVRSSPQRAS